ncbi:hypothetical protein TCAL_13914, partial [Tigriopus californicus]|eukprot:TCALIF_13914-PA protein Name:"Protein of unknown function" AED:0.38 eAED:0.38 QI:41/0.66/0.25/0.75/1/0.75/4/0/936
MTLPTESPMGSSMEPPSPIEPSIIINMPQEPTEPGPEMTSVVESMLNPINQDQNDIRELGANAKACDDNEAPILHMAVEEELFDVTPCLIRHGAKATDSDNKGNTVIHALAQCHQKGVIEAKKIQYLDFVCQSNGNAQKSTLDMVLRHRDPPRKAEYLRYHLLLAIAMYLSEQAEFILDYAQSLFPFNNEGEQHLRTVLYGTFKGDTNRIEKTHLKMTPLVMTLHGKMPHLTNKLIEAEQRHLMPHDNELSHEKARAHHASSISDPQSLQICLESGNPSRKIWKHYFDYLNKEEQLFARIGALNIEDKIIYLRLHRRWAVRDLNLSGLKLVTNALNYLNNEEQKQRIVCQPQQTEELLLFVDNNNADGNLSRLLEEFITQEFECHKSDQKQGYQCVLNQVDDISGSDYILDAFETHYPNSTSSKWKSLSKFAVITFYGLAVMGMNIWTDTVITKALDCASNRTNIPDGYGICNGNQDVRNSKAIPPTDPDDRDDRDTTDDRKWNGTNFQEAFNISSGSQLLHLTTTLTLWIWLLGQLIQPKSIFTYLGFGSAKQGAELEGIEIETGSAEIPLVERNRSRSGDSNASQMEKQVKSKQIISFCVLGFPVFAAAVMVFCILSGFWPELDWVWLGNTFSMSLIVVLAIAGLVIKCKMIFGQDNFLQDRDLFDSLDKQLTIAQIGESCMEATVQFILQTWLFARLQLADELHKKTKIEITVQFWYHFFVSGAKLELLEVLVSGKIFLSSMSLICSVSTIHFNLKNQNVPLKRKPFIFLSLAFQLWAQMRVILALCSGANDGSQDLNEIKWFWLIKIAWIMMLKAGFWFKNRKLAPFSLCNICSFLLSTFGSSMLLLQIPMLNNDNKKVTTETFGFQFLYFLFTFGQSVCWVVSRGEAFWEIAILMALAFACHAVFYLFYGHPGQAKNRKNIKKWMKKKKLN